MTPTCRRGLHRSSRPVHRLRLQLRIFRASPTLEQATTLLTHVARRRLPPRRLRLRSRRQSISLASPTLESPPSPLMRPHVRSLCRTCRSQHNGASPTPQVLPLPTTTAASQTPIKAPPRTTYSLNARHAIRSPTNRMCNLATPQGSPPLHASPPKEAVAAEHPRSVGNARAVHPGISVPCTPG